MFCFGAEYGSLNWKREIKRLRNSIDTCSGAAQKSKKSFGTIIWFDFLQNFQLLWGFPKTILLQLTVQNGLSIRVVSPKRTVLGKIHDQTHTKGFQNKLFEILWSLNFQSTEFLVAS